jgi:transcription-repair coupling factor (superfamily II helicase)
MTAPMRNPFVGSSDALVLARAGAQGRTLFIVTSTAADAERLAAEIAWFRPELAVHRLPDWETLPYDHFSPHPDLVSERLATLYQFVNGRCDIGLIPITTAMLRFSPGEFLAARSFFIKSKTKLDIAKLRSQLTTAGYTHTTQVMAPGEYSIRGGLIDLFPMGSAVPYRMDLMDEDIESIKTFDIDTQRSIYPVPEIRLLPAREFPLDDEGRARFRENFRDRFEGDPSKSRLYKDVTNGLAPPGIEYYLPLFFESTATLFDYAPSNAQFCLHGDVHEAAQAFWKDTKSRYDLLRGDRERPLLPPADIFVPVEDFFAGLKPFERVELERLAPPTATLPALEVDRRSDDPSSRLKQFLGGFKGRTLIAAESVGRRETISQFLAEQGLRFPAADNYAEFAQSNEPVLLVAAPISTGFVLPDDHIALITESELYATQVRQSRRRDARQKTSTEGMLRDLAEVKIGDPVVHAQHGIGRYMGLVTMDLGEGASEFLHLQYDGGDILYVPVTLLHVIGRYTGANPESAPLHKLGSGQWEKAKRKAAQQVRDTAAELLNLYARRAARKGFAFPLTMHDYDRFSASFQFEETPDQAEAIKAVIADMTAGKPMDRLVCGDVGFGKTEVAMRAAFVAVTAGKQVAILVPTTLLAEQHFLNFSDRFAEWPVRVAELSRFRSPKEVSAALKGLEEGSIDIVIGTHKLIQKDVRFKNLGLVILDEEHRFGVRQKEELKALRTEVDVLTLTATPIPRTLAMSLEGLRDFSVIATAPQKRLSIKTFVSRLSDGVIREAVLRELQRGGQVYYLYNEVDTIQNQQEKLAALLPEARIAVAHGQLRERELEHVMRDFYHQRFNVLLCSTIIETGIDVPSANTILIHRADKFGLAQLHQLRGRVGRSHHQAYAYLLTPPQEALTANAKKRLEAIQMMEDLGAGFHLAMHDLEIRGAGEVLGDSQSGDIQEIGFTLYTEMLDVAVRSLKAGREPDLSRPLNVATEINLHAPALLPDTYCGDIHERLVLYKRLANCESEDALLSLQEELIDRFGLPPEPTQVLLASHGLRIAGKPLEIAKIDAGPSAIVIQFGPDTPLEPQKVIALIQKNRRYKLAGSDKLRVEGDWPDANRRVAEVKSLLKQLAH